MVSGSGTCGSGWRSKYPQRHLLIDHEDAGTEVSNQLQLLQDSIDRRLFLHLFGDEPLEEVVGSVIVLGS